MTERKAESLKVLQNLRSSTNVGWVVKSLDELNDATREPGGFFKDWRDGWKLGWTGFKPGQDHSMLAGQWLAWKPSEEESFYSSTPGRVGRYRKGDIFDISTPAGQKYIRLEDMDARDILARAIGAKEEAYRRLVDFMEKEGVLLKHSEITFKGVKVVMEQYEPQGWETHEGYFKLDPKTGEYISPDGKRRVDKFGRTIGATQEEVDVAVPEEFTPMTCPTCGPRPWKTAPPLDSRDKVCPNCGRKDLERL